MNSLSNDIVYLTMEQDIETIPYYDGTSRLEGDKYMSFEFNGQSVAHYKLKINDSKAFINNYINILLKYNKIKINDMYNMCEIYDKFISSRYIFDILSQTKNIQSVIMHECDKEHGISYREYEHENMERYNFQTATLLPYYKLHFIFDDFEDDFFRILLTTNSVTCYYKKFVIQMFIPDIAKIYSDIYILVVYFYSTKLSFEEFINKHKHIINDYKLLTIIINYLNKSGNACLNHHSIVDYNKENYFEIYLLMFCNKLIKYAHYDNLLIKFNHDIDYDIWFRYDSQQKMNETLIKYLKDNNPELLQKHIIINNNIYNTIHNTFPDDESIILFDDFCNECKRLYKGKIYTINQYKGNKIREREFNSIYNKISHDTNEYIRNHNDSTYKELSEYITYTVMHSWHANNDKGQTRNAFMQMLMNNEFDEFITVYNIVSSLGNDYKSLFYTIISKDEMNIIKMLFNLDIQIFNIDKDKMIIKNKQNDNDKPKDTSTHDNKVNHNHSLFSDVSDEEPFNVDSSIHDDKINHYRNIWNDVFFDINESSHFESFNTNNNNNNNIKKQLTSSSDDYIEEEEEEEDISDEDISNTNNNNNNNIKKQLTSSSEEYYDEEEEEDISDEDISNTNNNNNKLTSSEEYYDEEEEEDYTSDEEGLTSLMRSMLSSYTNA